MFVPIRLLPKDLWSELSRVEGRQNDPKSGTEHTATTRARPCPMRNDRPASRCHGSNLHLFPFFRGEAATSAQTQAFRLVVARLGELLQ